MTRPWTRLDYGNSQNILKKPSAWCALKWGGISADTFCVRPRKPKNLLCSSSYLPHSPSFLFAILREKELPFSFCGVDCFESVLYVHLPHFAGLGIYCWRVTHRSLMAVAVLSLLSLVTVCRNSKYFAAFCCPAGGEQNCLPLVSFVTSSGCQPGSGGLAVSAQV